MTVINNVGKRFEKKHSCVSFSNNKPACSNYKNFSRLLVSLHVFKMRYIITLQEKVSYFPALHLNLKYQFSLQIKTTPIPFVKSFKCENILKFC